MNEDHKGKEQVTKESENTSIQTSETHDPWLPIETKIVLSCLIGGLVALIVLATFVNLFILGA